jgi:hypothetical protein
VDAATTTVSLARFSLMRQSSCATRFSLAVKLIRSRRRSNSRSVAGVTQVGLGGAQLDVVAVLQWVEVVLERAVSGAGNRQVPSRRVVGGGARVVSGGALLHRGRGPAAQRGTA